MLQSVGRRACWVVQCGSFRFREANNTASRRDRTGNGSILLRKCFYRTLRSAYLKLLNGFWNYRSGTLLVDLRQCLTDLTGPTGTDLHASPESSSPWLSASGPNTRAADSMSGGCFQYAAQEDSIHNSAAAAGMLIHYSRPLQLSCQTTTNIADNDNTAQ
jgi:hypothetical protein